MVQWVRIHLLMEHRDCSLVQEDPVCHKAAKSVSQTTEPALQSPHSATREATAVRSPHAATREYPLLTAIREKSACTAMENKNKYINYKGKKKNETKTIYPL